MGWGPNCQKKSIGLGSSQQGTKKIHITLQFDNRMNCIRLLAPIHCKSQPKVGRLFSIAGEYFWHLFKYFYNSVVTHSEFQKVISHKNVVKNHLHYNINMGLSFVNNKKILKLKIMDHVELCIKIWIILLTSFCF